MKRSKVRASRVSGSSGSWLDATDRENLHRFKRVMVDAGYLDADIAPFATMTGRAAGVSDDAPTTTLNTLVRLFHNGKILPLREVERALRPLSLEPLIAAGILRVRNDGVEALVDIQPCGELLIAVEHPCEDTENIVMLVSGSTLELSNFAIRRHSRNTADLGTGCGFLALMAARHSDHVFALDLNPRAAGVTHFNCVLNGISNVTCRTGDMFEPVRGERFDLIVSNPPYVISPFNRLVFRDAGMAGDQFCLEVARQGVRLLNQGGYLQMLFQWPEFAGEDWRDGLAKQFGDLGCDLWCMRLCVQTPRRHVSQHMTGYDDASVRERWLKYLAGRKIARIGTGLITLRRCSSQRGSFMVFDDAFQDRNSPYGDAVERLFINREFLQKYSGKMLLIEKFLAWPGLKIKKRRSKIARGRNGIVELVCEQGLKYSYDVQSFVPHLIAACDGRRQLGRVIEQMAKRKTLPTGAAISDVLNWVRELTDRGLLIPTSTLGGSVKPPSL